MERRAIVTIMAQGSSLTRDLVVTFLSPRLDPSLARKIAWRRSRKPSSFWLMRLNRDGTSGIQIQGGPNFYNLKNGEGGDFKCECIVSALWPLFPRKVDLHYPTTVKQWYLLDLFAGFSIRVHPKITWRLEGGGVRRFCYTSLRIFWRGRGHFMK